MAGGPGHDVAVALEKTVSPLARAEHAGDVAGDGGLLGDDGDGMGGGGHLQQRLKGSGESLPFYVTSRPAVRTGTQRESRGCGGNLARSGRDREEPRRQSLGDGPTAGPGTASAPLIADDFKRT